MGKGVIKLADLDIDAKLEAQRVADADVAEVLHAASAMAADILEPVIAPMEEVAAKLEAHLTPFAGVKANRTTGTLQAYLAKLQETTEWMKLAVEHCRTPEGVEPVLADPAPELG